MRASFQDEQQFSDFLQKPPVVPTVMMALHVDANNPHGCPITSDRTTPR